MYIWILFCYLSSFWLLQFWLSQNCYVAPHPHTDFGYLGFSFFFLHIFLKKITAFAFWYIQSYCGTRCLRLQFNISGLSSYPLRCFFIMNVTDILNLRSELSFIQLAFVFNFLFILNICLCCTVSAVLFVTYVHIQYSVLIVWRYDVSLPTRVYCTM